MTAIAIITTIAGVIVATDGGAYGVDGTLSNVGGKVITLPEASTVITNRGSMGAKLVLQHDLSLSFERLTFDSILASMPEHVARIDAFVAGQSQHAGPEPFTAYVAGWSEQRRAYEAWAISSYGVEGTPARTLYRLPECYLSPGIRDDVAEFLGIQPPSVDDTSWRVDPLAYASRAVCAARFCRIENVRGGEGAEPFVGAGAFVQVTFVQRHSIASSIVHEWPDRVGEKIDPSVGDPAPGLAFGSADNDRPAPRPVPGGRPGKRARRRHR